MIEIANDLQMSLAKQNFDHWLISIKQQDCFFLEQQKKIKTQQTDEGLLNY